MKSCCEEYRTLLVDIEDLKAESPATTHERLDKIKAFVKAEWERHVNDAGEASWAGD